MAENDRHVLEINCIVDRPIGNSAFLKERTASLQRVREEKHILAHLRQTFYLAPGETVREVELGEVDTVNFAYMVSSGPVFVELGSASVLGFGKGKFGKGHFGGSGSVGLAGIIDGEFIVKGEYAGLYLSNMSETDAVNIDLFAAKYA